MQVLCVVSLASICCTDVKTTYQIHTSLLLKPVQHEYLIQSFWKFWFMIKKVLQENREVQIYVVW